jgi:hypothetical protein
MVDSWLRTGMGRSVLSVEALPEGSYYHRLSNRHYTMAGGRVRRHQVGASGTQVNVMEKAVSFLVGSGNHAITPVHRAPGGKFVEIPVSWYSQEKAWAMSPGYDRPDHLDFRRPVTAECLFCHAAYRTAGAETPGPIDCERCHGEVARHLQAPRRGTVLNPARLPADRQLDICLQCHLETASRGFPDSLRLPGRDVDSFRPGEKLSTYKAYFDRADGADRFEINHAGYRLLGSRCFTESGGRMTCTTCHDPHTARARNACRECHTMLPAAHPEGTDECASCHMAKRTTEDAIHVRMTDHRIARPGPVRELRHEDHRPYTGDVVAFGGWAGPQMVAQARALHVARTTGTAAAWAKAPPGVQNQAALGDALMREGKQEQAREVLRRVLQTDAGNVTALNGLAVYEGVRGNVKESMRLLERVRAADPEHPLTWINLGVAHEAEGDRARARQCYDEAVRLQPDSVEARRRRAALGQE